MTQNEKVTSALRDAAAWIENHPELPPIYCSNIGVFSTYDRDKRKDLVTIARAMGHASKDYSGNAFFLKKDFGGVADITYVVNRDEVCERVVVGTKVVAPVPERIIAAVPEHEVEVVEWRCKPLMNQDQFPQGVPQLAASIHVSIAEDDIPF